MIFADAVLFITSTNNIMKTALLIAACFLSFSLFAQSIKQLDANNGFKKYKLGSKYQGVYGTKAKQADGSEIVMIGSNVEKVGDIPVKSIQLVYLSDILSKIIVQFESYHNAKLLEALKGSFGEPSESSSNTSNDGATQINKSTWKGGKLNLEYFYGYPKASGSSNSFEQLRLSYTSNDFSARLAKSKKANYSAKDF
jgi:hypothetical protein